MLFAFAMVCAVGTAVYVSAQTARSEHEHMGVKVPFEVRYLTKGQDERSASMASVQSGEQRVIQQEADTRNEMMFLSPDRQYLAVTYSGADHLARTYITNTEGARVVAEHLGYPVGWTPDSREVLLSRSIESTGYEREMYRLSIDGEYTHTGLPSGVHSAAVSPKDGSIVYGLTDSATDDTDVYLRTSHNTDIQILDGAGTIYAWFRWSPDGERIALLKSDLYLTPEESEIWIMDADGGNRERIANVAWSYPPIWSPDAGRVLFSQGDTVYEYTMDEKTVRTVTDNAPVERAIHPVYAPDGETILFSDTEQIWSIRNGKLELITSGSGSKLFPIAY